MVIVVVGAGVAGASAVESLLELGGDNVQVVWVAEDARVKAIRGHTKRGRVLHEIAAVEEHEIGDESKDPRLSIVYERAVDVNFELREVTVESGHSFRYDRLLICTGARPNVIPSTSKRVMGIRDVHSVDLLLRQLKGARRVLVAGNGGIAMEAVYAITLINNCEVVWAIRDLHFGVTFLDASASAFLAPELFRIKDPALPNRGSTQSDLSLPAIADDRVNEVDRTGQSALGWTRRFIESSEFELKPTRDNLTLETNVEVVENVECDGGDFPLLVKLSNGHVYDVDILISATGVTPNVDFLGNEFSRGSDGGVLVNERLETSVRAVYAAGDSCTFNNAENILWFQMRLWSQARCMGIYAAHCILDKDDLGLFAEFDMFAHVTHIFNKKLVLLGRFNGQGLGEINRDFKVLLRCKPGEDYVKVIIQKGRMVGAVLIGETGLEETFESVIMSGLDLSRFGEDLLSEDVDLEDYFD